MGQFGGSSQGDDFGYFGPAKPPAQAGSQFGGPPAAQSPFGAPPSAGPNFGGNPSFGQPVANAGGGYAHNTPPIPQRRKNWLRAVLALVLAAGAVWLGVFVWDMHQVSKDIVMPTTLGGRPAIDEPKLKQVADDALAQLRATNPGKTIEAQLYGTRSNVAIAVVARGHLDMDKEWADVGSPATTKIGKNECAVVANGAASAVCIRSSRTLAVEVVVVGGTITDAAAGVDQMWAEQR